jgi:hypothetical protein
MFVWHCHNKIGNGLGKTKLAKCECKILAVLGFNKQICHISTVLNLASQPLSAIL